MFPMLSFLVFFSLPLQPLLLRPGLGQVHLALEVLLFAETRVQLGLRVVARAQKLGQGVVPVAVLVATFR